MSSPCATIFLRRPESSFSVRFPCPSNSRREVISSAHLPPCSFLQFSRCSSCLLRPLVPRIAISSPPLLLFCQRCTLYRFVVTGGKAYTPSPILAFLSHVCRFFILAVRVLPVDPASTSDGRSEVFLCSIFLAAHPSMEPPVLFACSPVFFPFPPAPACHCCLPYARRGRFVPYMCVFSPVLEPLFFPYWLW